MKAALPVLAASLGLVSCVPSASAPAPASAPVTRPAPRQITMIPQTVPQAPRTSDWADAAITPGTWRYTDYGPGRGKRLAFGLGEDEPFEMSCVFEPHGPQIVLTRDGRPQSDPVPMTIRTETEQRTVIARAASGSYAITALPAGDPLLDAMALSKSRFAIEVEGLPPLYLPSWAEVSRVIEDCR